MYAGNPVVFVHARAQVERWMAHTEVYPALEKLLLWRNGRTEAVAPGIPDLSAQEKRDRVSAGSYRKLAQGGSLRVAEGLRVQPPGQLWALVRERWGQPELIVCDRFRLPELQDCVNGTPVVPRVTRWSEASEDIRALRRMALDRPLARPIGDQICDLHGATERYRPQPGNPLRASAPVPDST